MPRAGDEARHLPRCSSSPTAFLTWHKLPMCDFRPHRTLSEPHRTSEVVDTHLYVLEPPYPQDGWTEVKRSDLPRMLRKGIIVALRPDTSTLDRVLRDCDEVARYVVNAPVVLRLDLLPPQAAVDLAGVTYLRGIQCALRSPVTNAVQLREHLADPTDWPHLVVRWVQARTCLPGDVTDLVEEMARRTSNSRSFKAVADTSRRSRTAWVRRFARAEIGTPAAWFDVLRKTRIGMAVQRSPTTNLDRLAYQFDYSSGTALSDSLYRTIGARATFIRGHLGWQWMLTDALNRQGLGFIVQ